MNARQEFLDGAMKAIDGSVGVIDEVFDDLIEALKRIEARNEGLAAKLRRANEENAGLWDLRRAALELEKAQGKAFLPPPVYDAIVEVVRVLNDQPNIEHQHQQRDLVWALEELAATGPEHHHRIMMIADRFNLTVMMPLFPEDDEPGNDQFTVEFDAPEVDEELLDAFINVVTNGTGAIVHRDGEVVNLGSIMKSIEAEAVAQGEPENAAIAQAFAGRVLPALSGLLDDTEVHVFVSDDGMVGVAVDPSGMPTQWFDDWIGNRQAR